MEVDDAIDQLRRWCAASAGEPIEIAADRIVTFESQSVHTPSGIGRIEQELGCVLPDGYKKFMHAVGESKLFANARYGGGVRFYKPEDVVIASTRIWAEEKDRGLDRFCFVGEHRSMGDFMGFVTSRPGPKNFDVYCHEYPPGEYVAISDELKSWRSFESWLIRAVESLGQDTL